ncbi:MAG TPA: hypothetical protein DCG06_08840 [Deltaproteobacteria bacterium]|nr:hypothetical protein [Deltaproteobacteria bacterium]
MFSISNRSSILENSAIRGPDFLYHFGHSFEKCSNRTTQLRKKPKFLRFSGPPSVGSGLWLLLSGLLDCGRPAIPIYGFSGNAISSRLMLTNTRS